MAEVDLVVNTFERTYREVLGADLLLEIERTNLSSFARRVALINNVDDRADAERMAHDAVQRGAITHYAFVADRLPQALEQTGVKTEEFGPIGHYTDWALTATCLEGSPWLLCWDADTRLAEPCDWIAPAIELMERDPRVMVVSPCPVQARDGQASADFSLDRELERSGDFALTQGFSDQLFLCRREELAAPIYHERCIARWRYPMAAIAPIFEARVDSWMRHHDRLRGVHLSSAFEHPRDKEGLGHMPHIPRQRLLRLAGIVLYAALRRLPLRPRCCRVL
ncbi:unannotated protein [freshwater metagenome]|uniref:Unannotated protein n=1 Tax=freshwater metagenome TaxID=449393 RepID=A0A6J7D6U1_9ZZZZ|nr:hypothetical protein [Actinomycetota bacterium]